MDFSDQNEATREKFQIRNPQQISITKEEMTETSKRESPGRFEHLNL